MDVVRWLNINSSKKKRLNLKRNIKYKIERMEDIFTDNVEKGPSGLLHPNELERCTESLPFLSIENLGCG